MLSAVFTVALFYSTFEAPILLDEMLHQYFPEVFYDVEATERVLSVLRPIGYSALAITIVLMLLGFAIKKGFLASLGSLVLYIPTFGYFAHAMFFLTGLGVLRTLWLPLLELSPSTLKLGCVVYLPFSYVPHAPLVGLVTAFIGLFVFLLGVTTWLYGRFEGYEIMDIWIYKYSRGSALSRFMLGDIIASSLLSCIGLGPASPLEVFRVTPGTPHLEYLGESRCNAIDGGSRTPHPATSTYIAV